ncbi:hypothetical protein Y032_0030g2082 [Ancylostoma ceylanicum]|uniref:Uncharacterized protein n=1 Tax=Ancylostoma ceylanicum TaxID=53326 RepID=A0A016URE4_9BILA|nr:hypothetical protein Y032_0030g2082 [Ancylostoma ceylanicum]
MSLNKWICGSVGAHKRHNELFGEQTVVDVRLLGLSRKALLDTGSQVNIVPLEMSQASMAAGLDLDKEMEEIPIDNQVPVYDASGNRISFKGAVRLTLQLENGFKQKIAFFVTAGGDGMLVLGTNALTKPRIGPNPPGKVRMTRGTRHGIAGKLLATSQPARKQRTGVANADKRVYKGPEKTETLPMARHRVRREKPGNPKCELLHESIGSRKSDSIKVLTASSLAGAKPLGGGEVGTHEEPSASAKSSRRGRVKEHRAYVAGVSGTGLPIDHIIVSGAGKVCSGGRIHSEMSRIDKACPVELSFAKSPSVGAKVSKTDERCESQGRRKRGERKRSRKRLREESSMGRKAGCSRMSTGTDRLLKFAQPMCCLRAGLRLKKSPSTGSEEMHLTRNDVCNSKEHGFESPGKVKRRRKDKMPRAQTRQDDERTMPRQDKQLPPSRCNARGTSKRRNVESHMQHQVEIQPRRSYSRSIQHAVPTPLSRDDSRFRRDM